MIAVAATTVADSVNMRLISKDYHETLCIDRSSCIRRRALRSRPTSLRRFQLQKSRRLVILFFSTAEVLAYERVPEEFIYPVARKILLAAAVFALIVPSTIADNFPASGPVASCKVARLHSGQAAAPKKAPLSVKRAIWAANQLRSKPYRYGGGHKSFDDRGYDCSGTISYVLGAAGLISSPMSSTEFRRYGQRGRGKWITVYACEGHTFAVIAGLRLDTTPWDNSSNR